MGGSSYTPVASSVENGNQPIALSEVELIQLKKSSRWVIFLCFLQLAMALVNLLCGNIIMICVSALFISFGIVGVAKQRPRLLVLHFVYSLVLYILSLIGFVLLILYCDKGCEWWFYAVGFFGVLFQAIGMRHSRTLICLIKKKNGNQCCFRRSCNQQTEIKEQAPVNETQNEAQVPFNMIPMYSFPNNQMIPIEIQPRMPQYFPMQPVQYPIMQQPIALSPMGIPQSQQQNQGVGLFPVMYKQI